jgi:hypothetical protein
MKEKIVYIAHPIYGQIKRKLDTVKFINTVNNNLSRVASICKKIHNVDIIPLAPYLASLQYLDALNFHHMSLVIGVNEFFFKKRAMDEVWLYGQKVSPGMKQEIEWAHLYKIPVVPKTKATTTYYKDHFASYFRLGY